MEQLREITEQLASTIMAADINDLPALAAAHEHLLSIERLIEQSAGEAGKSSPAYQTASGGEKLLEKIILNEVQDATASLQTVSKTVAELQAILEGSGFAVQASEAKPQAPAAASSTPETPAPKAEAQPSAPPATSFDEAPVNPDDAPLVTEFIGESTGHLESAEAALLQLEENPGDSEALNAIFRSFHTIKGVAGFLNLKQIGALAHAAENLLDLARHGKLSMTGTTVDVVLESIDAMKSLIASLDQAARQGKAPEKQAGLESLLEKLHAAAAGECGTAQCGTGVSPVERGTGVSPVANSEPAPGQGAHATDQGQGARAADHGRDAHATSDATIKVSTERLDALINMVGELVIAQSMVSQDLAAASGIDQRLSRNVGHLGKITRELQDLSMSMRMVPIQGVFQKMNRLVRDLARKACKEIDFAVEGSETELDRNVVEAISDPLVHMVRNSVDHGVEPPDQRQAAGKSRVGKVLLRAYHQAGNIVIEIDDDGRGLNKAKILKKAIAAGIVREGTQLSDQEIFKLIFAAGLSTADKVTEISGRGVGMDVVKRNVEALRGRIDIASVEGKGSTFAIRLPLTLAVIDGQVIRVGSQRYIIPITSIDQTIQPSADQLSTVQGRGEMCMVRGQLLPLFRLYRLFGVKPTTEDPTKSLLVIVQNDQQRCCLLVDELLGQQQVVIKSLGEALGPVAGISGGAILGDGNVSLILDIPGLIHLAVS